MTVRRDLVLILDFGGQYTQLIARRVREQKVYSEIHPFNVPLAKIRELAPRGIILSGGPASCYDPAAPSSRENEIWLDLDANAAGQAADQVQVASVDLDQSLSLVIHQHSNPDTGPGARPPGPRIACGDLEIVG